MNESDNIPLDDRWSVSDVRRTITNIFHAVHGTVTPQLWIEAVARVIEAEGAEATIRETARSFNEQVESIQAFEAAIDEDAFAEQFAGVDKLDSKALATALFNELYPRAKEWTA